ncbi:hypothetical protein [Streptomyces tsukubensis]|uniref:OAA-family lectin sugar binding domain-containing protein n=1 Tax=Streptomyces tsukubensis TaxID=83656 RepID=A0A1V4AAW6_9ACTN|nr:hypothetical protein [Streptomyces tsukubensis]OON80095.1 hypothetical protein B1H18_13035 [Streptomyces tsukubensis]QFR97326.1 hypothetical protein GBW32_35005 [Streptomyces tsukubensis]
MARYKTQIQWGGPNSEWHEDHDLVITLTNRADVVPENAMPATGTQVSWAGPHGNGSVTFFDNGTSFSGSAQFSGEGPVGYRGEISK